MAYSSGILIAVLSLGLLASAHVHEDLAVRYSNFKLLSSPSYELYWNVDEPTGNLSLAVRVQTTGWVGFGVSPNGGMPNSDVVMGWVKDDGTVVFQVSPPCMPAIGLLLRLTAQRNLVQCACSLLCECRTGVL